MSSQLPKLSLVEMVSAAFDDPSQDGATHILAASLRIFTLNPEAEEFRPSATNRSPPSTLAQRTVYDIEVTVVIPTIRPPQVHSTYGTLDDAKAKLAEFIAVAATEPKLRNIFYG
jgi:hypothetical protein